MSSFELYKNLLFQLSIPMPPKNKLAPSNTQSNDSGSTQGPQSLSISEPKKPSIGPYDKISIASTILSCDQGSLISQEVDPTNPQCHGANPRNCSVISEKPLNWAGHSSFVSEDAIY